MKLFFCLAILGSYPFVLSAEDIRVAERVKNKVSLQRLNYDGTTLTGNYVVGGGCQDHETIFEVKLGKLTFFSAEAEIEIYDETAKPDNCDSFVDKNFSINLKEYIKEKTLNQLGPDVLSISVKLPSVGVDL